MRKHIKNMTNYIDLTIGHFAGLEYKPFKQQNFKVFGYYYDNSLHFKGDIASANNSRQYSLFALGFLYFINTFR